MLNSPPYLGRLVWQNDVVGTGFIVHKTGLIATCYHVLTIAGSSPVGSIFTFEFLHNSIAVKAQVTNKLDPQLDVALLRIIDPLPIESEVAILISSNAVKSGTIFQVTGYGRLDDPNHAYVYLSASGPIVGIAKRDGVELIELESKQILLGMSGAPVIVPELGGVIGIVSGRYTPRQNEKWMEFTAWEKVTNMQANHFTSGCC